jgi:hypothetical protein
MNIVEYSKDRYKPYHFESSENFCDLKKIEKAKSIVIKKRAMTKAEIRQLEAIVKLEILRYKLAKEEIELIQYKELVKNIDVDFFREDNLDIFENTEVHDDFYYYLNEEYR